MFEGKKISFKRKITSKHVKNFILFSGDNNELHTDEDFCKKTFFKKPIVPGLLVTNLFSGLVYRLMPRKKDLYIRHSAQFLKSIPLGSTVEATGEIVFISQAGYTIIKISILLKGELVVEGEAMVANYD